MIRGTTPTHTFQLPFSTTNIKELVITYVQDNMTVLEKSRAQCELSGNVVKLKLKQEDTLSFASNKNASVQMKVLTNNGDVMVSNIKRFSVETAYNNEVIG